MVEPRPATVLGPVGANYAADHDFLGEMMSEMMALDPVRLICGVEFAFPDYKEPLVQLKGAVKGYMRGTLPYAVSDGRLPCAWCDPSKTYKTDHRNRSNLFDDLAHHVRLGHGMSGQQYRDAIGLMRSTQLISRRLQIRMSHRSQQRGDWPRHLVRSPLAVAKGAAALRANSLSPESLNKRGVCVDQIRAVAAKIAKDNGGVLRQADLLRQGISSRTLHRSGWTGVRELALEIGATVINPHWTDAEMLRAFQELAQRLKRTPSRRDLCGANGSPSSGAYFVRFGGLTNTARRCGLPPNLPRPVAEGDEIDILNQYAITGGVRQTAQSVHFGEAKVAAVLVKYGVGIIPNLRSHPEVERRKAREWAAEMAQRLAS